MNAEAITPPETVFANVGVEFEKTSEEQLKEMWAEATERMTQDTDPRNQQFIMRLDKKTLIKTEAELASCQAKKIPLRYGIAYSHAKHLLAEEDAKARGKKKRRAANKKARASRKCNR